MRASVFVSYSHSDSRLVVPVVALLRASRVLVFRDADGLLPGKRWREEIESAILNAQIVVVFWCHHAKRSKEVSREVRLAIANGRDVLPLLIDGTPLPRTLAQYQHIDFRAICEAGHAAETGAPRAYRVSPTWRTYTYPLGALALTVAAKAWLPPFPRLDISIAALVGLLLLAPIVVFLGVAVWRSLWPNREPRHGAIPDASTINVSDEQTAIARRVEAEILHRWTSSH